MDRLTHIQNKLYSPDDVLQRINAWKLKGDNIVFTNGCFDILHKGHVLYLAKAASEGNRLVVGLNSDDSVKRQGKGDDRPVNDEMSRAMVLAGLGFVDAIVVFDDDTPYELIRLLQPDVLVKGGDYSTEQSDTTAKDYIVGSDLVQKSGGKVITIPFVDGFSTTALINRLKKA